MGDTADGTWGSRELGGYIRREQGRQNPEYEPMRQAEIDDLSREAGRPLTEREAYEYLKRRTHRQAVGTMLEPKRDLTLEDIDRAERAWRLKQLLHADEAYQREMENRANQDSDVDGETEEE